MKVVTWLRGPQRIKARVEGSGSEQARISPQRRKFGLRGLLAAMLGIVTVGLVRLHGEGKGISSLMVRRYEAVYARLLWSPALLR